jgi:hypothetical protein
MNKLEQNHGSDGISVEKVVDGIHPSNMHNNICLVDGIHPSNMHNNICLQAYFPNQIMQ